MAGVGDDFGVRQVGVAGRRRRRRCDGLRERRRRGREDRVEARGLLSAIA